MNSHEKRREVQDLLLDAGLVDRAQSGAETGGRESDFFKPIYHIYPLGGPYAAETLTMHAV